MKKRQIVAMAVMGIMTVACTDYDLNGQTGWQGNELLKLSASISETVPTRAEGEPAKGTYYFSYIKSNENSYQTLEVNFTEGKDTLTDPTWKDINTNDITNKLFILDNVPYINKNGFTSSNNDTNKLINLQDIKKEETDTESRYNAGPAPTVPGEGNDLLWDTVKVENVSGAPLSPVHFDLEHRMSMLTFKLQSKDPEIYTLLKDIENVEVKLHRVITEPYQFNRLTGAITINSTTTPIEEKNAVTLKVAEYTSEEGAITESWIFPPQEFHSTGRPVLAITLTDTENQTRTFKGVLPESMLYEGKYEPLEFLSGCHLTVTVVLGNWDDLAINFRPVLVKKWVTYSAKDINAKQVGVYTAKELTELVTLYNENSSEDNLALWKYGVYNNGTWTFDLWKSITGTFNEEIIKDGKLNFVSTNETSFTFNSHGHTINGRGVDSEGQLKVGVVNNNDLTALVNAYNASSQDQTTLQNYGTYDETSSTWTFYLWTNLTGVNVTGDNLGFASNQTSGFTFISNGYTINGMHVNTDGSFVGVFNNEDLTALVEAYNQDSQDEEILQKYGTYNGSTWTFYLWKDLTGVTETDNSLGFITEEGKPSFTFKANGHTINGKTVGTDGTLTDNSTTDGGE